MLAAIATLILDGKTPKPSSWNPRMGFFYGQQHTTPARCNCCAASCWKKTSAISTYKAIFILHHVMIEKKAHCNLIYALGWNLLMELHQPPLHQRKQGITLKKYTPCPTNSFSSFNLPTLLSISEFGILFSFPAPPHPRPSVSHQKIKGRKEGRTT